VEKLEEVLMPVVEAEIEIVGDKGMRVEDEDAM